jgi:hypothetical protein
MPDLFDAEWSHLRDALSRERELADFVDRIIAATRPCVSIETVGATHPVPVGMTRIGGNADVPPGFDWPRGETDAMSFLGQVNLLQMREVAPLPAELPSSGLLSFFLDRTDDLFCGQDAFCRAYHLPLQGLERRSPPSGAVERFRECHASFVPWLCPPEALCDGGPLSWLNLGLSRTQKEAYEGFWDEWRRRKGEEMSHSHRFLGYPRNVQYDDQHFTLADHRLGLPPDECEPGTNRLKDRTAAATRRATVMDEAGRFRPLMQFAEDDAAEMVWIDSGVATFMLREEDWNAFRLEGCWGILDFG